MQINRYQIELRDVHLFAYHGVMEQERVVGADFTLNVVLGLCDNSCACSDDVNSTVSYADVYDVIKNEMMLPSNLLENVCYRILTAIFEHFASVEDVYIEMFKDTPPMGGDRLKAGVTMSAKR